MIFGVSVPLQTVRTRELASEVTRRTPLPDVAVCGSQGIHCHSPIPQEVEYEKRLYVARLWLSTALLAHSTLASAPCSDS